MTCDDSVSKPLALRTHRPGDIGYITYRHGEFYAREYGFNDRFESLVSRIGADFLDNLQPNLDRCWIAERNDVFLGCVMLVRDEKPDTAKLRLLFVDDNARGLGVGSRLIQECINFAKEVGYTHIDLWTQSVLEGARRLYSKAGFKMIETKVHDDWGLRLVGEFWSLKL